MKRRTCMEGFFGQFLRDSSLHGVKYIGLPNRHLCEKLFWIVAILASLGASIYLVEEIFRKYFKNPIIISFEPQETTVARIPFPALTLCNVNILKTQLMNDLRDFVDAEWERFNKSNFTEIGKVAESFILSEHLTHHCLAAPSFLRLLNATLVDAFGETDYVQAFQDYFLRPNSTAWEAHYSINRENITEDMHENVANFRENASHHCEDMILKCMWAGEFITCDKLFNQIYTQHGSCCVFNMMPKYILRSISKNDSRAKHEMSYLKENEMREWEQFDANYLIQDLNDVVEINFPKHQKAGGKPYGLSILINPELDMYSTCNSYDATGFKMVAHSPISFPDVTDYGVAIPPSSEVFIDIDPHVTIASESNLMSVDTEKRGCYFPKDEEANLTTYKYYTAPNCMDECIARITYENCSCVRYFMPRNNSQSLCGARKLNCSEEVLRNITSTGTNEYCKKCKPACTEIKYKMQLSHFPLRENATTFRYRNLKGGHTLAENYSIVHIYLGADSFYAKERQRLYDIPDLIANAGGILSLTLGFSVISLVEVFYFFTLRAWYQRKEDKAAEEEDDGENDFYKTSRHVKITRKQSGVTKPRIMDGLQMNGKMNDYYNWAMTATGAATNKVNVMSSHQVTTERDQSVSTRKSGDSRRIPVFQLLRSRKNDEHSTYPYMS